MPSMPGPMELLIIAALALIVFGPTRLPEIARSIGRAVNEFRRHAADLKSEFDFDLDDDDDGGPSRINAPVAAGETPKPSQDPDPSPDDDADDPGGMDPDTTAPDPGGSEPTTPAPAETEPTSDKS